MNPMPSDLYFSNSILPVPVPTGTGIYQMTLTIILTICAYNTPDFVPCSSNLTSDIQQV